MTTYEWKPDHRTFAETHTWGVLATGRRDGSPQQSMVGYGIDEDGRIIVSVKTYTAKWNNTCRQPRVSMTVPDGRAHLVIYGTAETIADDPQRTDLTALVFGAISGQKVPDPQSLVPMLDDQQRSVLRITPHKTLFQD